MHKIPAVVGLALLACACALDTRPSVGPLAVNAAAAASSITAYRATHGRGPVVPDRRLNAIAAKQALAMARAGRIGHDIAGPLPKRLEAGGYIWLVGVENVSAGFDTFDAALAGWKTSAGHRANLLEPEATQIGVGAARTGDRYGTYWALLLAAPDPERSPGG